MGTALQVHGVGDVPYDDILRHSAAVLATDGRAGEAGQAALASYAELEAAGFVPARTACGQPTSGPGGRRRLRSVRFRDDVDVQDGDARTTAPLRTDGACALDAASALEQWGWASAHRAECLVQGVHHPTPLLAGARHPWLAAVHRDRPELCVGCGAAGPAVQSWPHALHCMPILCASAGWSARP